jgi:hypothetical protein
MTRRLLAVPLLAALAMCAPAAVRPAAPSIDSAESLIRAMNARYADTWYRTLSFTQTTTRVLPNDSLSVEEWREWALIPGHLRIDMGPPEEGRTTIFARDSSYALQNGRVVRRVDRWNDLMILGFDVYLQPVERSLAQLRRSGYDLSKFHEDTLDGERVYVVGAERGDMTTKQFAIEADRLLFMRLIDPIPNQPGKTQHVWFRRYHPLDQAWIAPEVEVLVDGRRVFHEVYADIRTGIPIDASMFATP